MFVAIVRRRLSNAKMDIRLLDLALEGVTSLVTNCIWQGILK